MTRRDPNRDLHPATRALFVIGQITVLLAILVAAGGASEAEATGARALPAGPTPADHLACAVAGMVDATAFAAWAGSPRHVIERGYRRCLDRGRA